MTRRETYIDHLRSVPLFSRLSKRDLNEIARMSTELDFADGQHLITEGSADSSSMLIIMSGTAVVRKKGRKVATLSAGDFAGELALLTHNPRNATIEATGAVSALVLDRRELMSLLDAVPRIAKHLLMSVAERLGEADRKSVH